MPIPTIYVDFVPLHVGRVHDSRQHMRNVRHCSPAFAIFNPHQFRIIAESHFVLRARLPVVPSVFLKMYLSFRNSTLALLMTDAGACIVHAMHPYGGRLFLRQSFPAFNRHVRSLPELQRLVDINIIFVAFPAFFGWKLHKIRVATMRLTSPSTASLLLPPLVCSDHFDTSHYTLQVPFSLLWTRSISQVLRMCRATPFAPKTRFLIITPQMSGVKNVYFRCTTFSIMTAFIHINYNYDFGLPYFYYELHPCPVISGYVLTNMFPGGFG